MDTIRGRSPHQFQGPSLACGLPKLHDHRLLADLHHHLRRAGLLRRADNAGDFGLGYLSGAAGHDYTASLAISAASDSRTMTSGSWRSALTISTSRWSSQL